jgi:hypothetical protein
LIQINYFLCLSICSISVRFKSYFRGSYRKRPWPCLTSPEAALTVTDVTGSGHDRKWRHGSDHVRMRNRFPRFFLTIVVQNVPLRMTDMATGSDVTWPRRVFPWKGVRMCNRFLRFFYYYSSSTKYTIAHDWHDFRMWRHVTPKEFLIGAFSPEMTSSNVTP